jgi:MoxR-like ATPase
MNRMQFTAAVLETPPAIAGIQVKRTGDHQACCSSTLALIRATAVEGEIPSNRGQQKFTQWAKRLFVDMKATGSAETVEGGDRRVYFDRVNRIVDNISSVVLGKKDVARLCVIALLAGEHILLEDVPGVGKTLMGKALARSVAGEFRRIQFTPDLLPSDIIGSSVYKSATGEFEFRPGPIFSNFVLADEINRAPPRTQSALLEAMSDRQASVDGETFPLKPPFMVIATQNPFEFEGTYVLPESQLDRFLLRISMGYPNREFEQEILSSHRVGEPVETLESVCTTEEVFEIQQSVRNVRVDESISEYILDIVHATRATDELAVGVSTRGALLWYRATQAAAFVDGRSYAVPDDARSLAIAVCAHRVQTRSFLQGNQRDELEAIIRRLVAGVTVPE